MTNKIIENIKTLEKLHHVSLSSEKQPWIVVFRVPIVSDSGRHHVPVSDCRLVLANSVDEALQKFSVWANSQSLNSVDIYATDLIAGLSTQLNDIKEENYETKQGFLSRNIGLLGDK